MNQMFTRINNMNELYITFKNLVPKRLRVLFKPVYLRWSLRKFKALQSVKIKKYGFSIIVDPKNGAVDQYIYMHRNWETRIGNIIEKNLHRGDVFVDVGANIGYFSLLASRFVGQEGRVIAFEPISFIVKQFTSSIALNNIHNITVKPMAVGDRSAKLKLSLVPGNIGGSSLVKKKVPENYEMVDVSTLDAELSNVNRIDMIKIDVEGYEYEVLSGARNILLTYKPKLILEFSPNVYVRRDSGIARSILAMLCDIGYSIYDIDNKLEVENIETYLDQIRLEQTNLFAVVK